MDTTSKHTSDTVVSGVVGCTRDPINQTAPDTVVCEVVF